MQSLIKTATATWIEPADPATKRRLHALAELESRLAGDDPDPDLQQEIDALRKESGQAEQVRITVKTATVLDMARYQQKIRQAVDTLDAMLDGDADADQMRGPIFGALHVWSAAAVTVSAVETRKAPRWDPAAKSPKWSDAGRPDWLDDPNQFVETVPDLLLGALDAAIDSVNPGIFRAGRDVDDETKKNGGASASA